MVLKLVPTARLQKVQLDDDAAHSQPQLSEQPQAPGYGKSAQAPSGKAPGGPGSGPQIYHDVLGSTDR
jgi:hypothetical protein